jgi:hypothetical protein
MILKVTAFVIPEGCEPLCQKLGRAFEIGELTGWSFDLGQGLELFQVVGEAIREEVQAVHRPLMRHHFSAGCKFPPAHPVTSNRYQSRPTTAPGLSHRGVSSRT